MTANDIIKILDDASAAFDESASASQRAMWVEIENILKGLDIKNGIVTQSVANLRAIGALRKKIEKAVLNPKYIKSVDQYLQAFENVSEAQKKYFGAINENAVLPEKQLGIIRENSVQATIQSLTEAGINANVSQGVQNILKANITGGGSFNDLSQQMRDYILTNEKGIGSLERYTKQITTDAINQFNGQYTQAITGALGLKWYMYVGSNLTTTREFCELLTKKKYIYEEELTDILSGDIDGHKCEIYKKTGLPMGMIDGTNENNFQVYRGGYNCGHQLLPVAESFVPENLKNSADIKFETPIGKKKLDNLTSLAKGAGPQVDSMSINIAEKRGGVVTPINFKSRDSIKRKVISEYGGDISQVKDSVRNTIVHPDQNSVNKILEDLAKQPGYMRTKSQRHETDLLGYSGNVVNFKAKNGVISEIQVNTPKMIYAKEKEVDARRTLGDKVYNQIAEEIKLPGGLGHQYYEEYRKLNKDIPADAARMKELEQISKKYYSNFL